MGTRAASGCPHTTVGWDWYIDSTTGALVIAWGDVRSNVMGVDRFGADIGMEPTAAALGQFDVYRTGSTLQ